MGGVMLMGYEMYRLLATRKPRKKPAKKADSKAVIDVDQEDKDNELAIGEWVQRLVQISISSFFFC